MKQIVEMLDRDSRVSDYKLNITRKESLELFYVKGRLETVRRTDTTDREVTVYVEHDGFLGDAQFFLYAATTPEEVAQRIDEAVEKALLINNQAYTLPAEEQGKYEVESNFADCAMPEMAARLADAVFAANVTEHTALNAVEIFLNKYTEKVFNSRNLCKTQVRYSAMVEAIPTYNGETQSVELYEQYNISSFDAAAVTAEIAEKLQEVAARNAAVRPDVMPECPVVLRKLELAELMGEIAYQANYAGIYAHATLFGKGDCIQKEPQGDRITLRMMGELAGNIASAKFDSDGMTLRDTSIVEDGQLVAYYGANRYGQYLQEEPTGALHCMQVSPGTAEAAVFEEGTVLDILSMSGLQVDFYSDYIGGEIRLAYLRENGRVTPVTGISVSGKLSEVLNSVRFSKEIDTHDQYTGPAKALLTGMKIF
ncbi:MAG: hypothetical protein E7458_05005 [Ruminococcaceae bacterium]|nr:hypothetical protein [Oscillospiraceae bacterium]